MNSIGLNPCFDRIYFQFFPNEFQDIANAISLNPCFDRIYFQLKGTGYLTAYL